MTSVLICDERRGVRDGLAQFMSVVPGVDRVDTVASGDDMLERFPRERPTWCWSARSGRWTPGSC